MTEPINIHPPWDHPCSDPCRDYLKMADAGVADGLMVKTVIDVAACVDTTYFCEIGSDGVLREITREEYLGE